jgi:predicted esterase
LTGEEVPASADLAVDASFAFDETAFYLLVEARDDRLEFPDRAWRYGDGFFLTFGEPTPTFTTNQFITFGLSMENGRPRTYVVYRDGEGFPNVDISGVQFAGTPDADAHRIVYEASVPWTVLTPLRPLVDEVWGLNLMYADRDFGERKVVCLRPDRYYDAEETDHRITRPVRFVVGQADHVAVQFRPHRSHVLSGQRFPVEIGALIPEPRPNVTVDWRIGTTRRPEIDSGSLPASIGPESSRFQFEIPVDNLPSGTVDVHLTLRDGNGAELGRSSVQLMVFDVAELKQYRSQMDGLRESDDAAPDVRTSLPTARFLLENVEDYIATAEPCQDITHVENDLGELQRAIADLTADRPVFAGRNGIFRHAHVSSIDGTTQPYSVAIPEDYDPAGQYPLLVMLHGSGVDERGFIRESAVLVSGLNWIAMAPQARGLSDWYQGDSGRDVFECIDDVCKRYAVDPDRIFLYGFSMGGYGAWRLGLGHAERFAGVAVASAPLSRGEEDLTPLLQSVENLPLFVVHGTADTAISVEEARRAVAILRDRDYPALTYLELEGAGHGGYAVRFALQLRKWLRKHAEP